MILSSDHRRLAGGRGVLAFLIVFCLTGAFNPLARGADHQSPPEGTPGHAETGPEQRAGGNDLFVRSCARCHGKDGKGTEARGDTPSIPDFSSHKWQEKRSDAQLLTSILDGKGKEMPAFGEKITREKAQELVAFIRQWDAKQSKPRDKQPAEAPTKPPTTMQGSRALTRAPTRIAAAIPEARTLYQQHCARCHGSDGKGAEARAATREIPDFTSHSWQERRSDAQLRLTIREGKGKMMPAFGDKISQEQDRDLTVFVRSLDTARTTTPIEPESSFEQRFQQLEREMDSLKKQLRELQPPPPKP